MKNEKIRAKVAFYKQKRKSMAKRGQSISDVELLKLWQAKVAAKEAEEAKAEIKE